jgi:hypothetical protein
MRTLGDLEMKSIKLKASSATGNLGLAHPLAKSLSEEICYRCSKIKPCRADNPTNGLPICPECAEKVAAIYAELKAKLAIPADKSHPLYFAD